MHGTRVWEKVERGQLRHRAPRMERRRPGQRPDDSTFMRSEITIYGEATNALSRLSPHLYDDYVAAHVPFNTNKSN